MAFLSSLSVPTFLGLFFVIFLGLSAFFLLYKPLATAEEAEKSEPTIVVISTLSAVIGGFYAILFGLVVVNLWENFNTVQESITQEANDMAVLYLGTKAFQPEAKQKMQQNLREYVLEVRNHEWKEIGGQGASTKKAWDSIWNLFYNLQSYVPQTTNEVAVYTSMLNTLHDALNARRARIEATDNSIPPTLFVILFMGCVFMIYSNAEMVRRSGNRLIILTVAINFILAFYLTLIVDLSKPYREGQFTTSYGAFNQGILGTIK